MKKNSAALLLFVFFFPLMVLAEDIPAETPAEIPQEIVFIRNGDSVIFDGTLPLPENGIITLTDTAGTTHEVSTRSVLGLLAAIDAENDSFSISGLEYYPSFSSLYLKCMTAGASLCDAWQYTVNGTSPFTGMDSTMLTGGERIGIYFGPQNRMQLNRGSIISGESVLGTAEKYDYLTNTWAPRTSITIGVTVPNPNDPYSPTVLFSKGVDESGTAEFVLEEAGHYDIGVAEDYYFPMSPLVVANPSSGGAVTLISDIGTPLQEQARAYDPLLAIEYLKKEQHTDGSFGGEMYTDWAGVAFGFAAVTGEPTERLRAYLQTRTTEDMTLTDSERRSMTLLALGENPYAFGGVNYIEAITAGFDGTQFGDPDLINDDIFAIIPLTASGFTAEDAEIKMPTEFILSKQREDGSWEGSADMTAAAISALYPYAENEKVFVATQKAVAYLETVQKNDGGFGSVYTTSWVRGAMQALGKDWKKNENGILDYFGKMQEADGALLPTTESNANRIWATSYAVASEYSWIDGMKKVPKQKNPVFAGVNNAPFLQLRKVQLKNAEENILKETFVKEGEEGREPNIPEHMQAASAEGSGAEIPVSLGLVGIGILGGLIIHAKSRKT